MKQPTNSQSQSSNTTKIKNAILSQYKSVREFARCVDIPHGTIVSALNNGIEGMAYSKVIKMCDALHIDYVTFEPVLDAKTADEKTNNRLLAYYNKLNDLKKEKVIEYIKDIS